MNNDFFNGRSLLFISLIILFLILGIFLIIIGLKDKTSEVSEEINYGSLGSIQEPAGMELGNSRTEYTSNSKTTCNNGECVWESGYYVFEDKQWKSWRNARSLKDDGRFGNCVVYDDGKDVLTSGLLGVECIDFNSTDRIIKINPKYLVGKKVDIPIKVGTREELLKKDNATLSKVDKGDLTISNLDEQIITVSAKINEVVHLGEHSTTVYINDTHGDIFMGYQNDTGNSVDSNFYLGWYGDAWTDLVLAPDGEDSCDLYGGDSCWEPLYYSSAYKGIFWDANPCFDGDCGEISADTTGQTGVFTMGSGIFHQEVTNITVWMFVNYLFNEGDYWNTSISTDGGSTWSDVVQIPDGNAEWTHGSFSGNWNSNQIDNLKVKIVAQLAEEGETQINANAMIVELGYEDSRKVKSGLAMGFNVSAIPDGSPIDSVEVRMYSAGGCNDAPDCDPAEVQHNVDCADETVTQEFFELPQGVLWDGGTRDDLWLNITKYSTLQGAGDGNVYYSAEDDSKWCKKVSCPGSSEWGDLDDYCGFGCNSTDWYVLNSNANNDLGDRLVDDEWFVGFTQDYGKWKQTGGESIHYDTQLRVTYSEAPDYNITGCTYISNEGTYTLTQNITTTRSNCITINNNADDITIDCQGYSIIAGSIYHDEGIYVGSYNDNIYVENCKLEGFDEWSFTSGTGGSNITLDNIEIRNCNPGGSGDGKAYRTGVGTDGVIVKNSYIEDCDYGIRIDRADCDVWECLIYNNTMKNMGNKPLYLYYGARYGLLNITKNYIEATTSGSSSRIMETYQVQQNENLIYDNVFNLTTQSNYYVNARTFTKPAYNISVTSGENIVLGSNIGGNYWTNTEGTGWSDTCTDVDNNSICDFQYNVSTSDTPNSNYDRDFFPLSSSNYDLINPTIDIYSPQNYTYISGKVTLKITATDLRGINRVETIVFNETDLWSLCNDTTSPYHCLWSTQNYGDGDYFINATAWDNSGLRNTSQITVRVDQKYPVIEIFEVLYNEGTMSVKDGDTINLLLNVTDGTSGAGISNATVDLSYLNSSGNSSMDFLSGSQLTGEYSYWNLSVEVSGDTGQQEALIYVRDNVSNLRFGDKFLVEIDNSVPYYSDIETSPESPYNNTEIDFKITLYDNLNLSSYIFSTNYTGSWVNTTENITGNTLALITESQTINVEGNHSYMWTFYDDAGNVNYTNLEYIFVNGSAPSENVTVSLLYPDDLSYTNITPLDLNYTYTGGTADNCSLYFDGIYNQTVANPVENATNNFTLHQYQGYFYWDVECEDDSNVYSGGERSYTFDNIYPNLTITAPTNDSTVNITTANITFGVEETNKDTCWYTNNGSNTVYLSSCDVNITGVTWDEGVHVIRIYANDSVGQIDYEEVTFTLNTSDSIAPYFTDIVNITVEYNDSVDVTMNASDNIGVSCFALNDTSKYTIDCDGEFTNSSELIPSFEYLTITINDTSNLETSTEIYVNITNYSTYVDSIAPYFTDLANVTVEYNDTIGVLMNGSDNVGVSCWNLNDTSKYTINCSGYLTNSSELVPSFEWLNISINDTSNNLNYSIIYVNITNYSIYADTEDPSWTGLVNITEDYNNTIGVLFNATDNVAVDNFYLNDSTKFTVNKTGYFTNSSLQEVGIYYLTMYVNDTSNNTISGLFWVNITNSSVFIDTEAPTFTSLENITKEYNDTIDTHFTASDNVGVSCWNLNDTSKYTINCTGDITNSTALTVGFNYLNVSVNDTSNNLAYSIIYVNITNYTTYVDTVNPTIDDIVNITVEYNDSVDVLFNASDNVAIDCWSLNDTSKYTINCSGFFTNVSSLTPSFEWINVTVNDTSGNIDSDIIYVNITNYSVYTDTVNPVITSIANITKEYNDTIDTHFTASDNVNVDCWVLNDTSKYTINCTGDITNSTALTVGFNWINVTVNDTSNNIDSDVIYINITNYTTYVDNIAPYFTDLANITIEYNDTIGVLMNGSDNVAVDCWSLNDTSKYTINCSGYLTNSTALTPSFEWLNISINDTSNNLNYSIIYVNITNYSVFVDTIPPTFISLVNITKEYNDTIDTHFTASDNVAVDCWTLNDTTKYDINCTGDITNSTALTIGFNYLNISVNDTSNNLAYSIIYVNITNYSVAPSPDVTPPTWTSLTNKSGYVNQSLSHSITATDSNGISCYTLNDTSVFTISCAGAISNVSALDVPNIYYLNATANDTSDNTISGLFWINITYQPIISGASQCNGNFTTLQMASSNKRPYGRLCYWLDFR